jgi:hypothetical protein
MLSKLRSRLTYANVIATLALFLALGGGAYAALKLPKNSVGARQIKANAVTSSKVKNGSLVAGDFRAGQLPAGQEGAQGVQGIQGPKGDPGPITGNLPSGVTLRGHWDIQLFNGVGGGEHITAPISFGLSLASAPAAHFIPVGAAVPSGCSGNPATPGASPGNLCVFATVETNITAASEKISNATGNDGQADPFGAAVIAGVTAAADTRFAGTWAVTAP